METVDYLKSFGKKPRILLLEDNYSLYKEYSESLEKAGLEVTAMTDGCFLEYRLEQEKFDIILSDTEMSIKDGPEAIEEAIRKGLINSKVLILGMSSDYENQEKWRGIANIAGFYEKCEIYDIGEQVKSHYYNFKFSGLLWKEKIPLLYLIT